MNIQQLLLIAIPLKALTLVDILDSLASCVIISCII